MDTSNDPIWRSYVWHEGKCFCVSTTSRTFETFEGRFPGEETLVWEHNDAAHKPAKLIYQGHGVSDHQRICLDIIESGKDKFF